jgi:hypothetical protein
VRSGALLAIACLLFGWQVAPRAQRAGARIGEEVAVPRHLQHGDELRLPVQELVAAGRKLFEANWTTRDGGGRPLSRGTGDPIGDRTRPLTGSRAFNRISGPDANACQGCHNAPHGLSGGGGDFVTSRFDMAARFDFATFDRRDLKARRGALDESNQPVSLQSIGDARSTPGLFGAGYLEMLARQMTADLQRIRDSIRAGESKRLTTKGMAFGVLARRADGRWDTSAVEGLSDLSLAAATPSGRPSLVVRPWLQSGRAISLREITNDSLNVHHGIQTMERFGAGTDPDGDRVPNELTRDDVTALTIFQATLPVPGRVIPNDPEIERAVLAGEQMFQRIGCASCHVPALPLDRSGWVYSEPNPYNPAGNVRPGTGPGRQVSLSDAALPSPRLRPAAGDAGVILVPAYTDFKLHDISDWSSPASDRRFLTRRLWGAANDPPYFHHGLFTTLRRAVLAHAGEAEDARQAFQRLTSYEQDCVIEFLKSLQVLPPGTQDLVVDEHYGAKEWPPPRT